MCAHIPLLRHTYLYFGKLRRTYLSAVFFCDRNRIEIFVESVKQPLLLPFVQKTVDFFEKIVYNEIGNLNIVRF